MDDKKLNTNNKEMDLNCVPDEDNYKEDSFKQPEDTHKEGTFKEYMSPKKEDTATDIYYKTECKLSDSKVAIPTYDSVEEAKDWVDDENKK